MANSAYYYNLYKQGKKEVDSCDKHIKELEKIKNSLISDFYDEQRNVNNQLGELKDDLGKGVRHDSSFDRTKEACERNKEKTTNADNYLKRAISELEQEIRELQQKKTNKETSMNNDYQRYQQRKTEERQEWLDKMNLFH